MTFYCTYTRTLTCQNFCQELDPQFLRAYECKGAALQALGRFDEALQAFRTLLSLDPNAHKVREYVTNLELRQASGTSGDVTLYANFRTGVTYAMSAPTYAKAEDRGDKRLAAESRKVEEGQEAREGQEAGSGGAEGISSRGAREVMERWLKEEEEGGDEEGGGGSEGELGAEGEREGPGRGGGGGDAGDGVDLRERETEDHAGLREDAGTEDPAERKLDAERRRETQRQRLRARESEREREREEEAIGGASQHMREDMVLNERGASNVSEGESIEGGASGTGCANVEASGPW